MPHIIVSYLGILSEMPKLWTDVWPLFLSSHTRIYFSHLSLVCLPRKTFALLCIVTLVD